MGNICFTAERNCYATCYSYGEICVGCNCCGRSEKGLSMWQARLEMHKSELDRNINFDNWHEKVRKIQEKNRRLNITYHKAKIKFCEKRIEYFTNKFTL